jgi:hypothetical protein
MTLREFLSAMEAASPYLSAEQRAAIWRDVGRMLAQGDALQRGRAIWDERKQAHRDEEQALAASGQHTAQSRRTREPA